MPPKNSSICSGGNCLIAYLYVLVSPRLCRNSAKKGMSLISHRSAATSIFYSTYKFRLQRLLISCLYLCSTYEFDGICNILSLRALLVDQLSAFNASHRVIFRPLLSIAALHVLKHSTTSFTVTGGFVNICPTPAVAIDT